MTPDELVGWTLLNTAAVTAYTSIIYHGSRPRNTGTPGINYFAVDAMERNGMGRTRYQISCRHADPQTCSDMARAVVQTFNGSAGTGVRGTNNGFDLANASLELLPGLQPEPDSDLYHVPVDVMLTYDLDTVS